ncbi:hypothetical protein Pyn_20973 [Prunus yedoensis var. nudiflora]|uniref:Uncharacterized protein n=1 Tax=Prunus yedoensis var. nudiflora TaxID=2094558 RepID=A0A314ZHU1_PRUYE|nr:hypothetical protein Pyn_20973 [Prunus yedoensis var. nudiflora]
MGVSIRPCSRQERLCLGLTGERFYLGLPLLWPICIKSVKTRVQCQAGRFWLARQIEHDKSPDATVAAGTMGYLAPDYLLTAGRLRKPMCSALGRWCLRWAVEEGQLREKEGRLLMAAEQGLRANLMRER